MTGQGRRPGAGRRASLPPADWTAPQQLAITDELCTVLFIEEKGEHSRPFDFTELPVAPSVQRWLARTFSQVIDRGGVKRIGGANSLWSGAKELADALSNADPAPRSPAEITPGHVKAMILAVPMQSKRTCVDRLRWLLRDDGELPTATREAIFHGRLPEYTPEVQAHTEDEHRQIMTAARHDIRVARDRIAEGRRLLARYRAGELGQPQKRNPQGWIGHALDTLDSTGDLPRIHTPSSYTPAGEYPAWISRHFGRAKNAFAALTLTPTDLTAFALLLMDLTSENLGTITAWPAAHFRPDAGLGGPALALVDADKPRRGPSLELMVTPLEDLPASLGDALRDGDDKHLMRSALRIYLLLLDLTALARRYTGGAHAFSSGMPATVADKRWQTGVSTYAVDRWAASHGFGRSLAQSSAGEPAVEGIAPSGQDETSDPDQRKPSLNAFALRRFVLERGGKPVAHTSDTFHGHYQRTSETAAAKSRTIMREALHGEVAKAREVQQVQVLGRHLIERAKHDPEAAAAEAGVAASTLMRLITGEQDTVILACSDPNDSPVTGAGRPCGASFLTDCLRCENARALPRQLPVQIEVHDRLTALRSNMDAQVWSYRLQDPYVRLGNLLACYSATEREDARARVTSNERRLAADLVDGRLDLR